MDVIEQLSSLTEELSVARSFQSKDLNELATSLAKAQGEFASLSKGEQGYGYSYTSLAATIDAVRPILAKNGLSVSQFFLEGGAADIIKLKTMLLHSSGQYISSVYSMPVPDMKGVNASQQQGAAGSYARRYALQAILNLGTEDNDCSSKGFDAPKSSGSFKKETKPAAKKAEPEKEAKATGEKPNFRRTKKAEAKPAAGVL